MSQSETACGDDADAKTWGARTCSIAQDQAKRFGRLRQGVSSLFFRGGPAGLVGLAGRGLGLVFRYRAHRHWLKVIGGETTRRILETYPRIAFRHSTTYLFEGASWNQRLILLEAHYGFLNRTHDAAFFDAVIGPGGFTLWRQGVSVNDPTIALVGPCTVSRHREGELGLNFSINGVLVYKLAFSVVPLDAVAGSTASEGSRLGLFVGQVQGSPNCLDLLRDASKLCQGIAPRDLLMSALVGLAQAWNVDQILGVRADLVLSSESCSFDYNAFWEQYGGELTAGGHYAMALPFHEGPIRAASSAHRRRTRRKRQFQAELSETVAGVLLRERGLPDASSAAAALNALHGAMQAALHPPVERVPRGRLRRGTSTPEAVAPEPPLLASVENRRSNRREIPQTFPGKRFSGR